MQSSITEKAKSRVTVRRKVTDPELVDWQVLSLSMEGWLSCRSEDLSFWQLFPSKEVF